MLPKIIELLRCPIDSKELELVVFDREEFAGNHPFERIKNGLLLNKRLNIFYPVYYYTPIMVRFETNLHQTFSTQFAKELSNYTSYSFPKLDPEKGEKFIQNSFSEEWNLTETEDDELSFQRTDQDLVDFNKFIWLKWIKDNKISSLLNVGCGAGKESIALQKVTNADNIIAIDFNFSILKAAENYRNDPKINFILCSLFHIPVEKETFDLVYSQGVIHHTYSTNDAFNSVSKFVKRNGFLFIWVYALEDHLMYANVSGKSFRLFVKHSLQKLNWMIECTIRPIIGRSSPFIRNVFIKIISLILHPIMLKRVIHPEKWKFKNTEHSIRDLYSPIYAWRHSINEVVEWYENADYSIIDFQSPKVYKEIFNGKKIHGIGLTGKKN
jgi:ubiquinone/menaquinone biosynthesis C-methylase UbiE/uncharacterized protein YbaR (Trm112 family)